MNIQKLRGLGVALVTPFTESGEVDQEALKRVLEFTYAQGQGVDYWVVMGTTGESATLNAQEKRRVLDFVLENNPGNLPIVYGIGGNNTQSLVESLRQENLEGVQAVLSVSPYYNKPSQAGLIQHYTTLADASPCPMILYNVPGRTASNLKAETSLALAEHENIIALKEANSDINQIIEVARHKPEDFLLLSGDDMNTLALISAGGEGVISVLANAFPQIFGQMVRSALEGDFAQARKGLFSLAGINPLMYQESNPVGVKQAMALQGVCSPQVRLPLLNASDELKAAIQNQMPSILVS